jgi:acyl-CoA synthetase (AMP-forming)/AMP-acid ligase II
MLVQHFLESSARRLPNKVALICGDRRLRYREIDERANCVARFLRENGIERQDRVAIFLDNSVESVISVFGILKADAIFLMLSATLKPAKLSYILKDCQVKALITHTDKLNVISGILGSVPTLEVIVLAGDKDKVNLSNCPNPIYWQEIDSLYSNNSSNPSNLTSSQHVTCNSHPATRNGTCASIPQPSTSNIDLDLATIIYTSGSTGNPKGVMLTHLNVISAATSITTYLENQEDDIIINVLPLSFDYGLYQVLMAFKFGGTVVLEKSFAYPYQVIQKIIQEKVTGFPGVPTLYAILLGLRDLDKLDFSSLRYMTNTAAALPPAHIERLRKVFPHVKFYSMYGLTECKRVSYLPPQEIDRRPTSIGRGMPNEEVWIVDEKGNPVRAGTVGELVVRGANVMRGYWGLPEETERVLRPGKYPGEIVLHTGDLFKRDEEGFLYFVGRKDDMIKSKGERISPKEIEQCLCAMEGVAEAAVIGIPDEILGQAIKAFIRCQDGKKLAEKDVLKHCKIHLEDFMIPQSIKLVVNFPKTSSGKIDKLALKELKV